MHGWAASDWACRKPSAIDDVLRRGAEKAGWTACEPYPHARRVASTHAETLRKCWLHSRAASLFKILLLAVYGCGKMS